MYFKNMRQSIFASYILRRGGVAAGPCEGGNPPKKNGTKMIGRLLHFVTLVGSRSSTAPASATSPAASAATPAAGAAAATPAAQAQALQASMAGGPHLSKSLDVLSMLSIILGTA